MDKKEKGRNIDEDREAIAEVLRELDFLGFNPSEAKVLAYLIGRDPCKSENIERGLSFSQPRVHRALKTLRDLDLVNTEVVSDWNQRGSPPYLYSLKEDWIFKLKEIFDQECIDIKRSYDKIFDRTIKISDRWESPGPLFEAEYETNAGELHIEYEPGEEDSE